jgi:hypothetical protein
VVPLDFLVADNGDPSNLRIDNKIKNNCGYKWLTPDTISKIGEMGVFFDLQYNEEQGWFCGLDTYLIIGDGKSTWFDIINVPILPYTECNIVDSKYSSYTASTFKANNSFTLPEYKTGMILYPG